METLPDIPHLLVLSGDNPPDLPAGCVEAFAEAFGADAYTARHWLGARVPRLLRRFATGREALEWVGWLASARVRAFAFPESALEDLRPSFGTSYGVEPGVLRVGDRDGGFARIGKDQVCALVVGTVRTRRFTDTTTRDGLFGQIDAGGGTTSADTEQFLDIHAVDPPGVFRLAQHAVDYARLFPGDQSGSNIQFRRIANHVRVACPGTRVFESFDRAANTLGQSVAHLDRRTYLQWAPVRPAGCGVRARQVVSFEETEAVAFHLYSIFSRFEVLVG